MYKKYSIQTYYEGCPLCGSVSCTSVAGRRSVPAALARGPSWSSPGCTSAGPTGCAGVVSVAAVDGTAPPLAAVVDPDLAVFRGIWLAGLTRTRRSWIQVGQTGRDVLAAEKYRLLIFAKLCSISEARNLLFCGQRLTH